MFFTVSRGLDLIAFLISLFLITFSFYLQYIENILPCPLCLMQRVLFIVITLLFFLGAIVKYKQGGRRLVHSLILLICILGILIAGRQIYLENSSSSSLIQTCHSMLANYSSFFPVKKIFSYFLKAPAECNEVTWEFLGLSVAAWSLIFFILFLIVCIRQLYLDKKRANFTLFSHR